MTNSNRRRYLLSSVSILLVLFAVLLALFWLIGRFPFLPHAIEDRACREAYVANYGDSESWHIIFKHCYLSSGESQQVLEWVETVSQIGTNRPTDRIGRPIIFDFNLPGFSFTMLRRTIVFGQVIQVETEFEVYFAVCPASPSLLAPERRDVIEFVQDYISSCETYRRNQKYLEE